MNGCSFAAARPWSCPDGRLVLRADAPRDDWLAARRAGIGSSDASAVLGVNRWTSAYEVWAEKRGIVAPDPGNVATELGHELEPIIVRRWSQRAGVPIRKAGLMAHRERPWQLASVDRLGECGGIVEAKSLTFRVAEEWEDGQTPDHAEVQVQHQLAVTGRSHAHVVGLQDGRTELERTIVRDDDLIADLTKIEAELWQMVLDGVEPPIDGSAATTEVLAVRWPDLLEEPVDLDEQAEAWVREQKAFADEIATLTVERDERLNKLRAALGPRSVGTLPCGKSITWKRNGTFASKRFAADEPELAARITHPIPQLDVAALKGGRPELHAAYRSRVLRLPTL